MRKISLLALFAALMGLASGFAQNASLEQAVTNGIFQNEIDAALSVYDLSYGPSFRSLTKNYLFGGVDNPYVLPNVGSTNTFSLGYHQSGASPWSASLVSQLTGTPTGTPSSTVTPTFGAPVTVGTTTYPWKSGETTVTYDALAWKSMSFAVSGLAEFKAMNLLAGFNLSYANNDARNLNVAAELSSKTVATTNVNTGGAGVPAEALALTATTTFKNVNNSSTLALSSPLLFKLGSLPVYANVSLGYSPEEVSTSTVVENAVTSQFTGTATDSTVKSQYSSAKLPLGVSGQTALGTLVAGNARNVFIVGGSFSTAAVFGEYKTTNTSQFKTVTAGAVANGTASDDQTTGTVAGCIPLTLGAVAAQYLYFELDPAMILGLSPMVSISEALSSPSNLQLTQTDRVQKVDNNANGSYADAGDQTITTTTKYANEYISSAGALTAGATSTNTLGLTVRVPMALKVKPQGWPFSFTLATQGTLSASWVSNNASKDLQTVTVVTATVGGTTTTSTTNSQPVTTVSSGQMAYTASESHNLMISFLLPADAHMDVSLNGSNLLAFESLRVQAVIPLN